LGSVEQEIARLEKEISRSDHDLLMNYDTTIAQPHFFDRYQKKKKELEKLMTSWESITSDLETLR
jgi:ATP-binding cassette, subfamily F, member 3